MKIHTLTLNFIRKYKGDENIQRSLDKEQRWRSSTPRNKPHYKALITKKSGFSARIGR